MKIYNLCHKFQRTFSHNQYHDFFHRWKESNLERVLKRYKVTYDSKKETDEFMANKVASIKEQQTACVEKYIVKRWKKKIWMKWTQRNFNQDQLAIKNKEI